jgi:dienelactone hydrolase
MKSLRYLLFVTCLIVLAFSGQLFADCTTPCQNSAACPTGTLITYESDPNVGSCDFSAHASGCNDQRATCSAGKCQINLQGALFVPTTNKPKKGYPAIVFNHGSSSDSPHFPTYYCTVVNFFVGKGYVVFSPIRRGYALTSTGSSMNTGTYISDWLNEICFGICNVDQFTSLLLQEEKNDVNAAVEFLKNNSGSLQVNPDAVAVMGHSYGGIVTLFYNGAFNSPQCAVSISAGAESWDFNTSLQIDLKASVDNAKAPIFFLAPKNDVSLNPLILLALEAGQVPERYQAAIYEPVSYAPTTECAHGCFVFDSKFVKEWGNTAIDFLKRMGVK